MKHSRNDIIFVQDHKALKVCQSCRERSVVSDGFLPCHTVPLLLNMTLTQFVSGDDAGSTSGHLSHVNLGNALTPQEQEHSPSSDRSSPDSVLNSLRNDVPHEMRVNR